VLLGLEGRAPAGAVVTWFSEQPPEWAQCCPGNRAPSWSRLRASLERMRFTDRRTWTLVATILGSSMAFIDASVVNVALPTIGRDLGLGLAGRQWIFLAYSLALASFYLVGGATGDRYGHRRVFLWGVVGFAAASALAGAAPTGGLLIAARALQGVAGAFLTTGSLATLRGAYGSDSGHAVGLWTAWTGITSILGPPLGGAIVQYTTWRLIFYINLPLAVLVLYCARRGVADVPATTQPRRFDLVASALVAVGFGSLVYGLTEVEPKGLAGVAWAFALSAASLAAFALRERHSGNPLLPAGLFRSRNFVAANLETLLVYAAIGGSGFFIGLYLQTVIGYSPLQASVVFLPVSLVMLVLSGTFGRLADRHGPRLVLTVGPVLIAAAMVIYGQVSSRADWWVLAIGVGVYSLGLAMTVAPITSTALASVPASLAGIASGFNNTLSRLGSLIAVGVIGVLISAVYSSQAPHSKLHPLAEHPRTALEHSASVDAFRAGMLVAAALALAGAIVAATRVSDREALEQGAPTTTPAAATD
jgi:EmrB/QacA subfamily drug resistance transporter